jgi:hypothetical protein
MIRFFRSSALLGAALIAGACGGADVCEKPKHYQTSQPGKRIEVPEGLDSLNSAREMTIPEPSPRDPRPANAPCLEVPPSYGGDDDAETSPGG